MFSRIEAGDYEVFTIRPDGSDVRRLTDNQWEDGTPAWRPMPGQRASVTRGRH